LDHASGDHGRGPVATSSSRHQGLLAHTTLAISPDRVPLGVLPQQVWARDPAVRGIAKLGGFQGRKSDGHPRVTVMWNGFQPGSMLYWRAPTADGGGADAVSPT